MISHKHQCIFIHISKCAGTSIENAFGIDTENHKAEENNYLFGWDKEKKLWLQHATPQQLLDLNLISRTQWNSYYKFIVYRNSWDRAYSDYKWMKRVRGVNDSFYNYINKSGKFREILTNTNSNAYVGDHLNLQKDYFMVDGKRISYDREIEFEYLQKGFELVRKDLDLPENFFERKLNSTSELQGLHYSYFYNRKRRSLVNKKFAEDIDFFDFTFEDKRPILKRLGF